METVISAIVTAVTITTAAKTAIGIIVASCINYYYVVFWDFELF